MATIKKKGQEGANAREREVIVALFVMCVESIKKVTVYVNCASQKSNIHHYLFATNMVLRFVLHSQQQMTNSTKLLGKCHK